VHVFIPPKSSKGYATSINAFLSKKRNKKSFSEENRVRILSFFALYTEMEAKR